MMSCSESAEQHVLYAEHCAFIFILIFFKKMCFVFSGADCVKAVVDREDDLACSCLLNSLSEDLVHFCKQH